MEYVKLGSTGLEVSRLCLGCMTYGEPDRGQHPWTLDEERSRPLIRQALDLGINFFDTSNSYSDGSSEEILGRAIRDFATRDDVVGAATSVTPTGQLSLPASPRLPRRIGTATRNRSLPFEAPRGRASGRAG
jgi:1-deoxyxylulose-5-phosphate synthase